MQNTSTIFFSNKKSCVLCQLLLFTITQAQIYRPRACMCILSEAQLVEHIDKTPLFGEAVMERSIKKKSKALTCLKLNCIGHFKAIKLYHA